jgi:translin
MLEKRFIQKLKKDYLDKNSQRRQIISLSNNVLNNSKKAIFAIHRKDLETSRQRIIESEKIIEKMNNKFGSNRVLEEGSFMAALEEYVEAKLFINFIEKGKISKIKEIKIPVESYLGGICDLTGELVRKATNAAINNDFEEIEKINKIINEILNELIDFDITGYLRTKYDQARGNLRKIEQICYEVNLKNK